MIFYEKPQMKSHLQNQVRLALIVGAIAIVFSSAPGETQTVRKSEKSTPRSLEEQLQKRAMVREATHVTTLNTDDLARGHTARIHNLNTFPAPAYEGDAHSGVRIKIPNSVTGDFIFWYFSTGGATTSISRRVSVANRSVSSRSARYPEIEISNRSRFKKLYPENNDREPTVALIRKEWLLPGGVIQIIFTGKDDHPPAVGFAAAFTDGFNEEVEEYLPLQFLRVPVP